ncbi:MAG: phosphate/phosphite/phosphonate ABC transporter substrate-binding protein, partial [Gammaproteobacteria bacterium]|nr:phosphate/phosphite/phosphonate ABC transporter substrate-binding protein [Gammaproteobacteria bacterium]
MKSNAIIFLALLAVNIPSASADYIFSAPPREAEMRGIKLYGPLVQKLTEVLGENVVYEQPSNWLEYAKKMRNDEYDIIFDGPHFNAWRIKHLNHVPVASLPGALQFYLVSSKEYRSIKTHRDLVGRKICGMPSPHLATDMVL